MWLAVWFCHSSTHAWRACRRCCYLCTRVGLRGVRKCICADRWKKEKYRVLFRDLYKEHLVIGKLYSSFQSVCNARIPRLLAAEEQLCAALCYVGTSSILLILSKDTYAHHNYVSGYHQETRNWSRANGADSQSYQCTRITEEDVRDEQRDYCHPFLSSPANWQHHSEKSGCKHFDSLNFQVWRERCTNSRQHDVTQLLLHYCSSKLFTAALLHIALATAWLACDREENLFAELLFLTFLVPIWTHGGLPDRYCRHVLFLFLVQHASPAAEERIC